MEIVSLLLMAAGFLVFFTGGIWFIVESFRESIWWGLGVLFVPFVEIFFLILHWGVASKPFGLQIIGIVLLLLGVFTS